MNFLLPQERILLLVLLIVFGGCAPLDVEKAFDNQFTPIQNNKVVSEYCQSCHLHKNFDSGKHMDKVRGNYKREFYRNADECRACHFIEKDWMNNQLIRKTRYPKDADRGMYKNFEQKERK